MPCNIVCAHCKMKSVSGGALKQNFMDNNLSILLLYININVMLFNNIIILQKFM